MAKKIIISFDSLPVLGNAFSYNININNIKILYNSGLDTVDTFFKSNLSDPLPPQSIQLRSTIEDTIAETIFTLKTYYNNSNIVYKVIGSTIEVLINSDNVSIQFINASNTSITLIEELIVTTSKLKYFLEYKNIINDLYRCQISQKNFQGEASQIYGNLNIDKGSVKDHLDPIRGTGLSLQLEASNLITLEDLYTEDEQEFSVKLYKNNKIYFVGYLKPDGVFQDYVRNEWRLNLDCIDGLGSLKNLSFVKETGLFFVGKLSALDIIYNCLKRSGISLNINTSINVLYSGLISSNNLDILTKTFLNSDRFVKIDNNTIMSCEDVLKSVLDIFCAVITQKDGEWYIYKPNELYINSSPLFRTYDLTNAFIGTKTVNLNSVLGSQINNYYPHHAGGNQRIEIKGGVSAFRLGYKYGFLENIVKNPFLEHNLNKDFDSWTVNKPFIIIKPSDLRGITYKPDTAAQRPINKQLAVANPIPLILGDIFTFKASVEFNGKGNADFYVQIGNYYLQKDGSWSLNFGFLVISTDINQPKVDFNFTINLEVKTSPLPISGDLIITLLGTNSLVLNDANYCTLMTFKNVSVLPLANELNLKGEFHTVQRPIKISSIVKENKEVFNGDNIGIVYIGALFKEDKNTLTSTWFRNGIVESKQLLRIAAEEELRISQKPIKIFTGNIYGYLDYFTVCNIYNVGNKFMPIEWSYDTIKNITNIKFLELYVAEISDIDYTLTYDYGETVKPTIIG